MVEEDRIQARINGLLDVLRNVDHAVIQDRRERSVRHLGKPMLPDPRCKALFRGKGPLSPSSSSTGAQSQKPTAREQGQHNEELPAGRTDTSATLTLTRRAALLFLIARVGDWLWRHVLEPVREVIRDGLS